MEIVYDEKSLAEYFARAWVVSEDKPVLIDRFLEDAFEADVDAISDGERVVIGGVMQHIEDAGIHSGDSACVLPPYLIDEEHIEEMRQHTIALARALNVVGLINVQYALKDGQVYVLEVNPRGSRTGAVVSKAAGVMLGETLDDIGFTEEVAPAYISVKEAVFPFNKFREFDPILGPEMRSTGEVMGISDSFGSAFGKAQLAADNVLPSEGAIFITVNDSDKNSVTPIARRFQEMGFKLFATSGTAKHLRGRGIPVDTVLKLHEGRPNGMDMMLNGDIQLLINTPLGKESQRDDYSMRQAAIANRVAYTTTLSAASAACDAILSLRSRAPSVLSLQEWHARIPKEAGV